MALCENISDMKTPTPDELASIKDISVVNVLSEYVFSAIDAAPGETYADQARYALENSLGPHAVHWFFATNLLSLWSNGGMQEVLLCDPEYQDAKEWELNSAVAGFKAFGCSETAAFIEKLIPKSKEWSRAIASLNAKEEAGETVAESEFERIWNEVDAYDLPFDEGFEGDPDIYEAMTRDIQNNPEQFLPN